MVGDSNFPPDVMPICTVRVTPPRRSVSAFRSAPGRVSTAVVGAFLRDLKLIQSCPSRHFVIQRRQNRKPNISEMSVNKTPSQLLSHQTRNC